MLFLLRQSILINYLLHDLNKKDIHALFYGGRKRVNIFLKIQNIKVKTMHCMIAVLHLVMLEFC